MEILAAVETLQFPAAIDLAAIVIGALTGGLLAAREGFAVSGVLLLAVSGGLGGGLIRDVLLADGPPVALTNQAYLPTVAITAAVTFFFSGWLSRLTGLLVVLDAATLGLSRDRRPEGAGGRAAERLGGLHRHAHRGRRGGDPRRPARPARRHRPAGPVQRRGGADRRRRAHRARRDRWASSRCRSQPS